MSEFYNKVNADQDPLRKLISKVPGFKGYIERENRRSSDKLLRGVIADRFEEHWKYVSGLQRELISQGEIQYIDDLESAAIKLRQFIDRVRNASYGYAGLFDAVKVNEEELARLYEYDLSLLEMAEDIGRAVSNVETSIGTEGLPAAIRHLTGLAQQCVDLFNRRSEVMLAGDENLPEVSDQ